MDGMQDVNGGVNTNGMSGTDGHGGMSNMDGPGMKMFFHFGYKEYLLFEGALTKSNGGFAGACLVVVTVALLYELLKFVREELQRRHRLKLAMIMLHGSQEEKAIARSFVRQMLSVTHLVQTGLHAVQIFLSYCLMLVFMTYNAYLALCVVVGAAVGYFATGWARSQVIDQNDHCH